MFFLSLPVFSGCVGRALRLHLMPRLIHFTGSRKHDQAGKSGHLNYNIWRLPCIHEGDGAGVVQRDSERVMQVFLFKNWTATWRVVMVEVAGHVLGVLYAMRGGSIGDDFDGKEET